MNEFINFTLNSSAFTTPQNNGQLVTIHLISLQEVILYFLIYLIIHIVLGIMKQKAERLKSNDKEHLEHLTNVSFAFKWWPFVFVILILLINL